MNLTMNVATSAMTADAGRTLRYGDQLAIRIGTAMSTADATIASKTRSGRNPRHQGIAQSVPWSPGVTERNERKAA
jgi:hypothetical protein